MAYDLYPSIAIPGKKSIYSGYKEIEMQLRKEIDRGKRVIALECYPGFHEKELLEILVLPLEPELVISAEDLFYSSAKVTEMIRHHLTDDQVFGRMSSHALGEFVDKENAKEINRRIKESRGLVIIYGFGAALTDHYDLLVYGNLARWEIQLRYRNKSISNWKADNHEEEMLRKVKRGYFFEWRLADRFKKELFHKMDYVMDMNNALHPKMVSGEDYLFAIDEVVKRPFRLVPYFDSGVWGGTWMQETFNVDRDKVNLAWCFDGVPEENSLYFDFDGTIFELPAGDVVYLRPLALMGEKVYGRYGTSFPIRFDFLDTINGGNLSLQVHPRVEYAQETFGLPYTQDESYYIMEAEEDAVIYLGVKNGVQKEDLMAALKKAQETGEPFPDDQYIYKRKIMKHDHFAIPAGTIHCSGKNSVVLEISATPNRFTFKLWDWGRMDMDGRPRPIHIGHGEKNIAMERDENWVKEHLTAPLDKTGEGKGFIEEKTGLHIREPIETRRHWFIDEVLHENHGSVNVLNLVEGEEAVVKSVDESFAPFVVHYGETFIMGAVLQIILFALAVVIWIPFLKAVDRRYVANEIEVEKVPKGTARESQEAVR